MRQHLQSYVTAFPNGTDCSGGVQGSHLAGGSQDSVGVGVEGAPLTLLEGVTEFLIHQRATLRKEASASSYYGSGLAPIDPGVCCKFVGPGHV